MQQKLGVTNEEHGRLKAAHDAEKEVNSTLPILWPSIYYRVGGESGHARGSGGVGMVGGAFLVQCILFILQHPCLFLSYLLFRLLLWWLNRIFKSSLYILCHFKIVTTLETRIKALADESSAKIHALEEAARNAAQTKSKELDSETKRVCERLCGWLYIYGVCMYVCMYMLYVDI